jgi:hypothetical protein
VFFAASAPSRRRFILAPFSRSLSLSPLTNTRAQPRGSLSQRSPLIVPPFHLHVAVPSVHIAFAAFLIWLSSSISGFHCRTVVWVTVIVESSSLDRGNPLVCTLTPLRALLVALFIPTLYDPCAYVSLRTRTNTLETSLRLKG